MEPMKPMEAMEPMTKIDPWWPQDLGQPSTSGGQNDMSYAFFADKHRLLIKLEGGTTTYDTGDHRISGVSQEQSGSQSLAFHSQNGPIAVADLKKLS